jgi:hypothetical protein
VKSVFMTQTIFFGLFITPQHGSRRKHSLSIAEEACLSNGHGADHIGNTALLLMREFISAGTCLPSRCVAMNVYCGSAIPAFRHHIRVINDSSRH